MRDLSAFSPGFLSINPELYRRQGAGHHVQHGVGAAARTNPICAI